MAWSPDGTRLASASYDKEVRIWDLTTGQTHTTLTGHTSEVYAVAWSPDGTRLASVSDDGTVLVHDLQDKNITRLRLFPLTCLVWSGAGIAVGGAHGSVVVLELNDDPLLGPERNDYDDAISLPRQLVPRQHTMAVQESDSLYPRDGFASGDGWGQRAGEC